MNINVTFQDFREMEEFCKSIVGAGGKKAEPATPVPGDVPALTISVPVQSESALSQAAAAPAQSMPTQPIVTQQPAVVPTQASSPSQGQALVQTAVPTTAQSYSADDLARAAMTLMDAGRMNDLQALLAQFGINSLPELPESQRGAFATALRGMGAKI
jgi:hypothetical protein|nr:MAG TPA: hypothetical protein [Caudoviricetes sp.]